MYIVFIRFAAGSSGEIQVYVVVPLVCLLVLTHFILYPVRFHVLCHFIPHKAIIMPTHVVQAMIRLFLCHLG